MLNTKFFITRHPWSDGVGLHLLQRERGEQNVNRIAEGLTYRALKEGEDAIAPMPLVQLRVEEAQQLMDELWHAGLRPSEGSGSAGALAATQRHLEDLRALVFKQPKPPAQ
jgi:hypothetical protein